MARKNKSSSNNNKSKDAQAGQTAAAAPSSQTDTNEIDSIFSAKPPVASTSKPTTCQQDSVAPAESSRKSKSSKRKKRKQSSPAPASTAEATETVKEVHDPSVPLLAQSNKKQKVGRVEGTGAMNEADADLFDSRGTKRARTEDGLPIYSVQELNIGLGGDTPECPFDCQCCF